MADLWLPDRDCVGSALEAGSGVLIVVRRCMNLVWQSRTLYIGMSKTFERNISLAVPPTLLNKQPLPIMASIRYDTELMMNHIAAMTVPVGSKFVTVLDPDSRRPAVISLSNNTTPILQLTQARSYYSENLI
jgi:hypothetical protein